MERKTFIKKVGIFAVGSTLLPHWASGFCSSVDSQQFTDCDLRTISPVHSVLQTSFNDLLERMVENGWGKLFAELLQTDMQGLATLSVDKLIAPFDKRQIQSLKASNISGFDDFAGDRLIAPGFPAYSLLYHALASPRVKAAGITYPSLVDIDLMENYIYAISEWNDLKRCYKISATDKLVLAVFAYEYRPAFKTAHHLHADFLYSRTGFSRIGNRAAHYDSANRCYVNTVEGDTPNLVAVTPAKYALFIAKVSSPNGVVSMHSPREKLDDNYYESPIGNGKILQPIRKMFNNDLLTNNAEIEFQEHHVGNKLSSLRDIELFIGAVPRKLTGTLPQFDSSYLVEADQALIKQGSSFWVMSKWGPLVRQTILDKQGIYFRFPGDANDLYFTTYSRLPVEQIEIITSKRGWYKRAGNNYQNGRSEPMYLNITHEKVPGTDAYSQISRTKDQYESDVDKAHIVPLFEDSICEGKVWVDTSKIIIPEIEKHSHSQPAYSVITAPDFFPQVDSFDLMGYDVAPGLGDGKTNFFEGGTSNLASLRIPPNPSLIPTTDVLFPDSYTLVSTNTLLKDYSKSETDRAFSRFSDPNQDKGYRISSYLPDGCSSIFAPGWDVTYDLAGGKPFLTTKGLGTPFVEDMKLCAAMNGMWVGSSPDASRTYQGDLLYSNRRNPTSVPLMDDELGFHRLSPSGQESTGWDGEQGPFLQLVNGIWNVNFTDLRRADVVQNALDNKLDFSRLSALTSKDFILRMDCLQFCIEQLPSFTIDSYPKGNHVTALTHLWLVSAERVNWGNHVNGYGIPKDLVGNSKDWITSPQNARVKGDGFLYVFTENATDAILTVPEIGPTKEYKGELAVCKKIFVCQVTPQNIAWKTVFPKIDSVWNEVNR
jgi:hypothetical protein